MKTRITKPLHQFQQVKSENLNDNIVEAIEEYNGGLNGQNMPVKGILETHIKDPSSSSVSTNSTFSEMNGTVQDYNQTTNWNVAEGGTDVWTPRGSVFLDTSDWSRGWNLLSTVNNFSDTILQFDSSEGMLTGCAVIDFHHGIDRVRYTPPQGSAFSTFRGYGWWTEWGLFVNDVLIAQTGYIYPRRCTAQLPFKVAVGTQHVKIDLRWKTNIGWDEIGGYDDDPSTNLDIFGATIWAREVKR